MLAAATVNRRVADTVQLKVTYLVLPEWLIPIDELEAYTNKRAMSITLQIPDSVARSLRLPEAEAEERLRSELALALYAQAILSFGRAAELAGVSRYRFADLLTSRASALARIYPLCCALHNGHYVEFRIM